MDVEDFFVNLLYHTQEAERLFYSNDTRVIAECADRLIDDSFVLRTMIINMQNEGFQDLLSRLHNAVYCIIQRLESLLNDVHEQCCAYTIDRINDGLVGRPKYNVSRDQLIHLKELGFTWTSISKLLHISRQTIYRYRRTMGIVVTPPSTDEQLRLQVQDILHDTPNAGEVYVWASLRARNIKVTRKRLRDILQLIDPVGRALRRRITIQRRTYNVKGANYLWHIDSNHKLVNFRFVFHGCVDGYSRLIIYLECLTNNKAASVESLFKEGVRCFGRPCRVRGDRGTENIGVARYMICQAGLNRGSFIVGRSVHNQRIERLWSEVNRVVSKHYKQMFLFMEQNEILDEHNEVDLFCLAKVFLPRIRRSLNEFIIQWNNHGLSTVHGRTPKQLWQMCHLEGKFFYADSHDDGDSNYNENPNHYGIDNDEELNGSLPEIETSNNVVIPNTELMLTEAQIAEISNAVNPFEDDQNFGIHHYLIIRDMVNVMLNNNA